MRAARALVGAVSARVGLVALVALGIGVLALAAAALLSLLDGSPVAALALAGAALVLAAVGIEGRRLHRRVAALAALEEVDRLALVAIAGDAAQQTRRLDRLAGSTERGIRAGLSTRVLREPADDAGVDPSLLAGILAFAPRQVIVSAPDEVAQAYTRALADLGPTISVLTLPPAEHVGAFLDRLAARRRSTGAPVPVFAAVGYAHVHALVWGATAPLVLERFRSDEFLVLAPPGSHAVVDDRPRHPSVRVSALGALGLLVAHDPTPR